MSPIPGIHHITAISGPAQANLDFYVGRLKQCFVKRTVNFDDPGTYHLYYGDAKGSPGSILTFFPFAGVGKGRPGPGMASAFGYGVADLAATVAELRAAGVATSAESERFGQPMVVVQDPDGAPVELFAQPGADGHAFHSVTLWLRDPEPTARLLTEVFGYQAEGVEREAKGERLRFRAQGGGAGDVVDLIRKDGAAPGQQGAGTIHHVAFRARDAAEQLAWRERLAQVGHRATPVIDRQYFDAIYFREPGGILFEIATDPPGFAIDEPVDALGESLKLPPQYEASRDRIEAALPKLQMPQGSGKAGAFHG